MTIKKGLVISHFGQKVIVESAEKECFNCHLKRNQPPIVVGDEVLFSSSNHEYGTIDKLLPRKNILARGSKKEQKILAANIDVIGIVMATKPAFSMFAIDKYVLAAILSNIQPLILVNKIDLITHEGYEELKNQLLIYEQLGYPVILTSTYTKDGLISLSRFLENKTSVFVGESGVGKSSIIGKLTNETIKINVVNEKGIGKHTTTATNLYHLSANGHLIDSPGVRAFDLWEIDIFELLQGFKEINHYAKACKFRDCKHLSEPSCAVQAAIEHGKISKTRYTSYKKCLEKISVNKKNRR